MFDPGFSELILLFIIGLLILGPERLPRVATQIGRWVSRARRTANQLRHQLEREIALNDIRRPPPRKPPKDQPSSGPGTKDSDDSGEAGDAANEGSDGGDIGAGKEGPPTEKSTSDS